MPPHRESHVTPDLQQTFDIVTQHKGNQNQSTESAPRARRPFNGRGFFPAANAMQPPSPQIQSRLTHICFCAQTHHSAPIVEGILPCRQLISASRPSTHSCVPKPSTIKCQVQWGSHLAETTA